MTHLLIPVYSIQIVIEPFDRVAVMAAAAGTTGIAAVAGTTGIAVAAGTADIAAVAAGYSVIAEHTLPHSAILLLHSRLLVSLNIYDTLIERPFRK